MFDKTMQKHSSDKTILCVDNCSAAKFRSFQAPDGYSLEYATPSQISSELVRAKNSIHLALVPVGFLPLLSNVYELFGNYGIYTERKTYSVLFSSGKYLEDIIVNRMPIHCTNESVSSRLLFTYLALNQFNEAPNFVSEAEKAHGKVLIGDHAITNLLSVPGSHVTDLGEWWFETTGLPFVFAHWVVRRDIVEKERRELNIQMNACLERSMTVGWDAVTQHTISILKTREFSDKYHHTIKERITSKAYEGMEIFLQYVQHRNKGKRYG